MASVRKRQDEAITTLKRGDEYPVLNRSRPASHIWSVWRPRRKRIVLAAVAFVLLFVFFKNLPTDVPSIAQRIDPRYGPLGVERLRPVQAAGETPNPQGDDRTYDGPVRFYKLASSLVIYDKIELLPPPVVLFAFSSLRSASDILPLACEMGQRGRNKVHVAVLGRTDVPVEDMIRVNGLSESCPVHWHDGRPDYAAISTDRRMMTSVRAALGHINSRARLSAVIFDDSDEEDSFFKVAVHQKLQELHIAEVPIPAGGSQSLRWIINLDGDALSHWSKVNIDIVIHPSPGKSGSLIRLLKTIEAADFRGLPLPGITIELPPEIEPSVAAFLTSFNLRWPPISRGPRKLTVRKRASPRQLTPITASLQTVESFYPIDPQDSHVLILSQDTELSPLFYHYVLSLLLEYKYSRSQTHLRDSLAGLSLVYPSNLVQEDVPPDGPPFMLSQLPNTNAALYFGDKWADFHQFLSKRLARDMQPELSPPASKQLGDNHPAFLEYLLELFRVQNQFMIYSNPSAADFNFVTVHTDLRYIPEELLSVTAPTAEPVTVPRMGSVLSAATEDIQEPEPYRPTGSLGALLEAPGVDQDGAKLRLPLLVELPIFSYTGNKILLSEALDEAIAFRKEFSVAHGGCETPPTHKQRAVGDVGELFCSAKE